MISAEPGPKPATGNAAQSGRIEEILRAEAPQVLGALTRRFGRFEVAEDAVQEALLAASQQWPRDGVPAEPRGWLIRIGYRRMVDLLRSEGADSRRERRLGEAELAMNEPERATTVPSTDDSLTLLLLCCHPALSPDAQVWLTLRAVGGLTTAEIARAYGATEATTASRISRAKQRLRAAGARFRPPADHDHGERVTAVLRVLYLIFNEGYLATAGDLLDRVDLAEEAIRLTRQLHDQLREDTEVAGLLALMMLTQARAGARQGPDGELITLEDQDRTRWDPAMIAEGTAVLDRVWHRPDAGPYRLQAAIAAVHAHAATAAETDWPQIAAIYLGLERLSPTAPVRLGRVVAVAEAYGADRGLALLVQLDHDHQLQDDPLTRQRFLAVRAHLLTRTGQQAEAAADFRAAAELTDNAIEQAYLVRKAEETAPSGSSE